MLADFRAELAFLVARWPTGLPTGAIHADYFTDNVLMNDEAEVTGVIDYYYACTDVYAYDLAVALNAWGFTPAGQAMPAMIKAFARAYHAARPLSDAEIARPCRCSRAARRCALRSPGSTTCSTTTRRGW
ncbi:MAG: phosphotransferase [Asticcacaulis sp.]